MKALFFSMPTKPDDDYADISGFLLDTASQRSFINGGQIPIRIRNGEKIVIEKTKRGVYVSGVFRKSK